MPELQRLRADHAPAVLAFELANRAYFASFISDRGDDFFDHFAERYNALLAEQEAGTCAFYLLVGEDGAVLGRFNLVDITGGTAELGYRIAQQVAGRGVATATVAELCRLAAAQHGLHSLKAAVSHENVASQKVLVKAGFVPVGPVDPSHLGGKPGTWYQRDLTSGQDPSSGVPGTLGDEPVSARQRAERPGRRINEIVHGQRRISVDTALRLARYLGTSERFWMNRQARYDLEIEKDRLGGSRWHTPAERRELTKTIGCTCGTGPAGAVVPTH